MKCYLFGFGTVENIVGKGENAGYQYFLHFPQCFQKPSSSRFFYPLPHGAAFWCTKAVENTVRKREIACYKQFLFFSQCSLPYMAHLFHLKWTLKCLLQFSRKAWIMWAVAMIWLKYCYKWRKTPFSQSINLLQFVSIWNSLKFCHLVMC